MKRCRPLLDSPQPPLWLPATRSSGMDMCFACHRTILLGISWTSTLVCSAGSDPEGPPRTRWFDVVKRDLDQLGLGPAAVEPLAQDRDKWRALMNLVGSMHDAPTGAVHETQW